MRSGDAAGCEWPVGSAPLPRPAPEWGTPEWGTPSGAAPPGGSARHSDAQEAEATERDLLHSSRQPFTTPGAGGYDPGPRVWGSGTGPAAGGYEASPLQQQHLRERGQPLLSPAFYERSRCVIETPHSQAR